MEAHPRTPHTSEPLYSHIVQPPPGDRPRRATTTRVQQASTPGPHPGTHRNSAHRTSGPRQPRPVLRLPRVAPPSSDADIETDSEVVVGRGRQPWYHVSASEFHEHGVVQPASAEISCMAHEGTPDTDDLSRVDPSGVSTIGQSDAEDGGRMRSSEDVTVGRRDGEGRWSRDSIDGSLCVLTSQSGSREKRLSLADLDPYRRHDQGDTRTSSDPPPEVAREGELDDIQTRLSSPQPCADPMWYRRGSGCEETGDMPAVATDEETGQQTAVTASGIATLSSQQKSVTWADQELRGRGVNPRHSCESYTSSVSSRSIHLEPPSAASSHEGSPAPTLTPGYPGGFPVGVISMATPPMTSRRPVPEGVGGGAAAVVMFPHHHSTGSVPPLSPTSLLSSGSSSLQPGQGSSSVTTTRSGGLTTLVKITHVLLTSI